MKKTLLLILPSLVLFACQKEDTEPVANGFVTHEYTCPKCGAKYSVTCKGPNIQTMTSSPVVSFEEDDIWTLITNPSWGEWTVADESGQNVPHYEAYNIRVTICISFALVGKYQRISKKMNLSHNYLNPNYYKDS